jgi:hypothetical protein
MQPMKIGALTAAGFLLLLVSALGLSAHAQPSPQVIAAWKLKFKAFDQEYSHQLLNTGDGLVLVERSGRIGKQPTQITRQSLAFSGIGCVVASRRSDSIDIYPAKRWGVAEKDLVSGKGSRGYSIALVFDTAAQAQSMLHSLEALSPAFARKRGACKNDVDLYGLQFGAIPKSDDTFSWTRNSMLGASDYTIWTGGGMLLAEDNTPKIQHAYYKMRLSSIACVKVRSGDKDLAPSVAIFSDLPRNVLAKDVGPRKPSTFTTGAIDLTFDDEAAQQAALDYLQSQSPVFAAKMKTCSAG